MPNRQTAHRRLATTGGAALVAGAVLTALGLTANPANAASGAGFDCTVTVAGASVDTTVTATVNGSANPAEVHVGDPVHVDGFQATIDVTGDDVRGAIPVGNASMSLFEIEGITGGVANPVDNLAAGGNFDATVVPIGDGSGLQLTTPLTPAPEDLGNAPTPGKMDIVVQDFTADLTISSEAHPAPVAVHAECNAAPAVPFTSVTVKEKPAPPTSAPPTSTPPTKTHGPGPSDTGSPTAGNGGGNGGSGNTGGSGNSGSNTNARPTLADTGIPHLMSMTFGGAALVLLGVGMMFLSRHRFTFARATAGGPAVDTAEPAETADDED